ncbi:MULTISPECIES: DUF1488 domain-containing protein [Proteus]|uniref:DUF1488 family protein n=1 Tax=Proteus vulgaris TaxID=585 RepID=A0A6G6SFM2_PROVU|nr:MULTISPECIES: DUF1488 domain-containing protein [Proteus]MBQ0214147.1 DUF1488 domain-containing protein [Proteus vulgaris]MDS0789761.1 DUF1488 domain-containing protein [Proteus vulgaris]QIF92526.1 DUF1488 family protein [Proteus vulgaris]UDN36248.1 DUF1488 domain-containing protein [Proteus sp. NMG38-2]UPK81290.1 DUF1488 domain-containing protein [Proteus vulgaris]
MNQSIQFPDRETWLAESNSVLFPVMINGMLFNCQITEQELIERFGVGDGILLFKQNRWDIEEEFEELITEYELSTLHPIYSLSMAD